MLVLFLIHSILPLTNCQLTKIVSSDAQIFQFENNQNLTFRGQELRNHVLQEFSTKYQVTQCALECHKTAKCKSFNFDENAKICQLNDATHEEFEDDLHNSTDKDYYLRDGITIDQEAIGPCGESPCQNDGSCLDVQAPRTRERGYICFCKKGWYGKNCEYEENRIDWSEWETWGSCSRTCGNGYQTRARACMDTVKNEVKSPAECYGKDIDYKGCVYTNCPRWGEWGAWSTCSTYTTCGRGHKERSRICTNGGKPGIDRYCLGPTNETAVCEGIKCDNAVRLADQGLYGEGRVEMFHSIDKKWLQVCADNFTATAGDVICRQKGFLGVHNVTQDTRNGSNNDLDKVKVNCTGNEWLLQQCHREEVDDCDVKAAVQCRVRGIWSLWTSWGECSVTCENGTRTRTRECNHPPPNFNGTQCPGNDTEYKPCTLKMCPSNGTWLDWGGWASCSVSCNGGHRIRHRICLDIVGPCIGNPSEIQSCSAQPCAVDGVWTSWASWSPCSVSCANGTQFRTRNCTGPFYGGNECEGPAEEVIECFPKICPVDGIWEPWADWSECTLPCGYGTRNRSRVCRGPFYGGLDCDGDLTQTEGCNSFSCPVDGMWMSWSEWEGCSVSCGGGIQNRTRECISPKHGGQSCEGASSESQSCQTHPCPVDGVWVEWSDWTECSVTCANGTRARNRTCTGPFHGGMNCTGEYEEEEVCVTASCPVDGEWKPWTDWDACNVTCGGGGKMRYRDCEGPYFGGKECKGPTDEWKECGTDPCPVDGIWNAWTNWTECSHTCGTGYQTRNRTCDGPYHNGKDCDGEEDHIQDCNTHPCPVDGYWGDWSNWTACNSSCGGGNTWRTRECVEPLHGGANCTGADLESKPCNTHNCPVDGLWAEWSEWSNCSLPCGNGTQTRNRTCIGPFFDGKECDGEGEDERMCNTHFCPINGVWEEWSNWTDCSTSCGRGTQSRSRVCDGPYHDGDQCEGPLTEARACHTKNCPVDGLWMPWADWSACDTSCGVGMRYRNRTCDGPFNGGAECGGDDEEVESCSLSECPVNGFYMEWTLWTDCPVTCGGGLRYRNRTCIGPFFGGIDCIGPADAVEDCGTTPCPVDGEWSFWSSWSQCNVTCGGGYSHRYRYCSDVENGGQNCTGPTDEYKDCNDHECPIDGVFDPWSEWSTCTLTCGTGTRWRNRTCDGPYYDGLDCEGDREEIEDCNTHNCPVDGVFTEWSNWTECSVTCGGGSSTRDRQCIEPLYGGAPCEGEYNQTKDCNTHFCPIDGVWEEWTPWESCNITCGGGTQWRHRNCTGPFYGGAPCNGSFDESQDCNTHNCPVDGVWEEWSMWGSCNVTCGGGIQTRNRTCDGPFYGGSNCTGDTDDFKECNDFNCPIDGIWEAWSDWENCSLECGGGSQSRYRECTGPFYGGLNCSGNATETKDCNTHHCPIDGVFMLWSEWYSCNVTCGGGTQWRNRTCIGPFHKGKPCEGDPEEPQSCNEHNCPIDGVWEAWSPWGGCDVTCGGGIQWRDRGCEGPFYGGANCSGPHNESQDCNTLNCPVDGVWMPWTDWGDCTVTCGGGMQGRSRTCEGPFYNGGNCVGDYSETQDCQTHECPVDGKFTDWSAWGSCDVTCGGGTQSRNRSCDGPYHGGQDCIGDLEEHQDCNTDACPVKSEWGQWEAWHQCSEACGGGMQLRYRQCPTDACPGINFDFQSCNAQPCKKKRRRRSYTIVVDGIWTEWANWGECSVSCGGGIQTRNRTCDGPYHGGADCVGDYSEEMECGTDPCPIPGEWMEWTLWSRCTTTCGGGLRYRSHECNMTSYGDLTAPCLGSENDTEECHTYSCNISATSCTQLGEWGLVDSTYADLKPLNQNQTKQRVYCDMDSENGIGVTVIGHDKERTTNVTGFEGAGEYRAVIQYNISLDSVIAIIDSSANCEQYLRWDCKGAVIHNPHTGEWTTFWTNRTSADGQSRNRYTRPADYFAGATPGSHKCACGMTNSCAFANVTCNCDANQDIWRFDEGNITIKDDLPILAFRAGDTGIPDDDVEESGKHTIGPVRCSG